MQVKAGTWYKTKDGNKAYVAGFDKVIGFWTGSVLISGITRIGLSPQPVQQLWNDRGAAQVPEYRLVEEWNEPATIVGWVRLTEGPTALGRMILFPTRTEAEKDLDGNIHRVVKVTGKEGIE